MSELTTAGLVVGVEAEECNKDYKSPRKQL